MTGSELSAEARELRNKYQRERCAIRKGAKRAPRSSDYTEEAWVKGYREYRRKRYRENPERQKEYQRRYWEKKAREATVAGEQLGNVGISDCIGGGEYD